MRKLVLVICMAALLASASVCAMAGDGSRIFLQFKAGWYDGTLTMSNSTASFGAAPTSATASATLGASSYNIATTGGTGSAWTTQKKLGSVGGSYSFTLVVAPGTSTAVSDHPGDDHAGMCYISAWNLEQWVGTTGMTLPDNYLVTVSGARIVGGDRVWTKNDLLRGTGPLTTEIGPTGFWYDYAGHYADWGSAITAGETFTVSVYPAPEPGSLLALGGGLIGMAGFALRRRRA